MSRASAVLWLRPQIRLAAQFPCANRLLYETDAVERTISPGSAASGWRSLPTETCPAHFPVGAAEILPAQESTAPASIFPRLSSSSPPLTPPPSNPPTPPPP